MPRFFFLLLTTIIISTPAQGVCDFKEEKVYLMSGAAVHYIHQLGILKSERIKGITYYHALPQSSKKEIAGGIFLSQKFLQNHRHAFFVFDRSQALEKMFKKKSLMRVKTLFFSSVGQTPFEVVRKMATRLRPHLQEGCLEREKKVLQGLHHWEQRLKSRVLPTKKLVFFIGKITSTRYPDLAMVRDGFVQWLIENKTLETYPSSAAYISPSSRWMRKNDFIGIGLAGHQKESIAVSSVGKNKINLLGKNFLIPGYPQLTLLNYVLEKLSL